MNPWLGIAVGVVLTVGTGLFVAAEFALVNLDRHELERRRDGGEKRLGPTIRALAITSTHLSSAQLGITLTTLLAGYTFEPALSALLRTPLEGVGLPDAAVPAIGAVSGIVVATMISMVLGELVPKNFALAVPLATARVVVPFQAAFTATFRPMVAVLNNTANGLIRMMGVEPQEELSGARSSTELGYLIRHSAESGVLEKDDASLLRRTLRFSRYDASELMTPRVRMVSVDADATAADVLQAARKSGYSRLPVVADGPDDVVGVVHVKRAFAVDPDRRSTVPVSELMVDQTVVPDSLGAASLLPLLRAEGLQMAIVADEYGGTAGLVTLEDLVEEIVGELEDEHDRVRSGFTMRGEAVSFDATWRPDELADRVGVTVPTGEHWDTVAGYVVAELGRVPVAGDEVPITDGLLRVERVDGHAVTRLVFVPAPEANDPEEAADDD